MAGHLLHWRPELRWVQG